jgi:hypothetical protein
MANDSRSVARQWLPTFIGAQILILALVVAWDTETEVSSRTARALATFGIAPGRFEPPRQGTDPGPITIKTSAGLPVDLAAAPRRRAVLLISECQSCMAEVLHAYDREWRNGRDIVIVSKSSEATIQAAVKLNDWRVPIYSEARYPEGMRKLRDSWRPWVLVIEKHRVICAQTSEQTWQQALEVVTKVLPKRGSHAEGRPPGDFARTPL